MNFQISFIFRIFTFINGTYIEAHLWTFASVSKLVGHYIRSNLCVARSAMLMNQLP